MVVNTCGVFCTSCDISVGKKRLKEHRLEIRHIENVKKQELSDDRRKNPRVRKKTLPTFQPPPPSTSFEHHVFSFISDIRYKPEKTHNIRQSILKDLKSALAETFGKCRFFFFGSMTVGLAFVGSDLDVYVEVDRFSYNKRALNEKHEDMSKVLRCSNALYRDENFTEVEPIFEAEVPIVKMVHVPSKISCDISFSKMGVESSRLVNFYLGRHRRFLEVMMLIKYWAKRIGICSGQKSISSYSWTLLFISYLQTVKLPNGKQLLPSLLEVQRNGGKPEYVNGCRVDCEMPNASPLILPDDPVFSHRGLLEGFFRYYKDFPFGRSIVSPFLGRPILCVAATAQKRSPSMDPQGLAYARCLDAWNQKKLMSVQIIQDPFLHGNLMSCPIKMLPIIMSCLAKASEICEAEQSASLLGHLFRTTPSSNTRNATSASNGNAVSVHTRTRTRRPKKAVASPAVNSQEPIPPQAIYNGEICEGGFFVPLKHIPIRKAVDAVEDILSKLMMFNVTREKCVNGCLQRRTDAVFVQRLLCVPLCPVPWILLKKKGLNTLVPNLHSKSVTAFRTEYFRTLGKRFSSRPSEIRRFVCDITKMSGPVMQITFNPSFVDSSGFSLHVTNFLRTSLEKWILAVLSNM